jgi:hypothetical protein
MDVNLLPFGAGLCALGLAAIVAVPAEAMSRPHAAAVKACSAAREGEPASPVTAIDDRRGGSLVWLTDTDANLWLCSADARSWSMPTA